MKTITTRQVESPRSLHRLTGPKTTLLFFLSAMISVQASAEAPWLANLNHPLAKQQQALKWPADGGEFHIHFNQDLLSDWGIQVSTSSQPQTTIDGLSHHSYPIKNTSSLYLKAPFGIFQGLHGGSLPFEVNWDLSTEHKQLLFKNLSIAATNDHLSVGESASLVIEDEQRNPLFYLDHIHTELDIERQTFSGHRMDLRVSSFLAKTLGREKISDIAIGTGHLKTHLTIPNGYHAIKGNPTCPDDRPLWPSEENPADVALIDMTWQQVRSLGAGDYVFTPNATLKNIGLADVVWQPKFAAPVPPYNNAQHPYLFWSAYRQIGARFEQIGVSQIKHAFFTVNVNCTIDCGDNHILYPGCEDIYTVNNNDGGAYLGPKDELEAHTGIWEEVGSFFDQNGDGTQDNTSSNGTGENRMLVNENDINDPNNTYYFSAWYVIRDDVNIFNSMGHRSYSLNHNGKLDVWSFSNPSPFTQGPASDAYATPNTTSNDLMTASHRAHQPGEGHVTVAVKVEDLGGGLYRYNYMIENHDYDPQIKTVSIPVPNGFNITQWVWSDIDQDANNDWTYAQENNRLVITAENSNHIDWGELFSFSFETNRPPQSGFVDLTGEENNDHVFQVRSVLPQLDDLIYLSGFEL